MTTPDAQDHEGKRRELTGNMAEGHTMSFDQTPDPHSNAKPRPKLGIRTPTITERLFSTIIDKILMENPQVARHNVEKGCWPHCLRRQKSP
jgi:hypothetical protein